MPQAQSQASTNPQQTREESIRAFERGFELYKEIFSGTPDSYSPGVSYRKFGAQTLRTLNKPETDEAIKVPLVAFFSGRIDLVDKILPTNMSRGEYLAVLLREARIGGYFEAILNNSKLLTSEEANKQITVTRPLDAKTGTAKTASVAAGDVVFRDFAMQLLNRPQADRVIIERDVARQLGVIAEMDTRDEIASFILGYGAATNPEFTKTGRLPLTVDLENARPSEVDQKLRPAFCAAVEAVPVPGRQPGLNQNNAVSAGFILGREHLRQNYAVTDKVTLLDVVCPNTPPAWNPTMSEVLTGTERGRQQAGAAQATR